MKQTNGQSEQSPKLKERWEANAVIGDAVKDAYRGYVLNTIKALQYLGQGLEAEKKNLQTSTHTQTLIR
jgi:hypothetical protein